MPRFRWIWCKRRGRWGPKFITCYVCGEGASCSKSTRNEATFGFFFPNPVRPLCILILALPPHSFPSLFPSSWRPGLFFDCVSSSNVSFCPPSQAQPGNSHSSSTKYANRQASSIRPSMSLPIPASTPQAPSASPFKLNLPARQGPRRSRCSATPRAPIPWTWTFSTTTAISMGLTA